MRNIETVMAFDFGLRRIGVAVGQTITYSANPVTTIMAKQGTPDWADIDKLIQTWMPQGFVVGRPTHLDGSEQAITKASDEFAKHLEKRYDLPVFRVDERLTSVAAKAYLIEEVKTTKTIKPQLDPISAKLICEIWLKEQRS